MFPGTVTYINEAWDLYYPHIIKISSLSKNDEIKTLLKLANGSKSVDKVVAFFLIPYLLPTTNAKNKKAQPIPKASKFEIQESFLVSFKVFVYKILSFLVLLIIFVK